MPVPHRTTQEEPVMDTQRFDALAATLAQAQPRRGVLRLLGAAVLSTAGLGLRAADESQARRKGGKGGKGGGKGGHGSGAGGGTGGGGGPADRCGGPVGICDADPTPCGTSATGEICGCERTVEGNTVCVDGANACPQIVECTSTQDCRDALGFHFFCQEAKQSQKVPGQFCGCGFGTATGRVCVAECDNADAFAAEARTGKGAKARGKRVRGKQRR